MEGTIYNVSQAGPPLQVEPLTVEGAVVRFSAKLLDLTFEGTLAADGQSISGTTIQAGERHTLTLQRVSEQNTWAVPETVKPMPADATPKFDVVTIKPSDPTRTGKGFDFRGRHMVTFNTNVNDLITFAYGVHAKQIAGGPAWLTTEHFDLDGVPDVEGHANLKQMKMLIQSALADRFRLTFHREDRELAVYALTLAKGGPKLTKTAHAPTDATAFYYRGLGKLTVTNATMADFCSGMQGSAMDKPVVDHTGLTDRYDFQLKWTPDQSQFAAMGVTIPPANLDDPNAPPSLYTALQEQLGLKMEPTRAKADVIVIDHIEKPTAN